eukprot:scaffold130195_cov39-Phaeocystis_antarctica.AAC.2
MGCMSFVKMLTGGGSVAVQQQNALSLALALNTDVAGEALRSGATAKAKAKAKAREEKLQPSPALSHPNPNPNPNPSPNPHLQPTPTPNQGARGEAAAAGDEDQGGHHLDPRMLAPAGALLGSERGGERARGGAARRHGGGGAPGAPGGARRGDQGAGHARARGRPVPRQGQAAARLPARAAHLGRGARDAALPHRQGLHRAPARGRRRRRHHGGGGAAAVPLRQDLAAELRAAHRLRQGAVRHARRRLQGGPAAGGGLYHPQRPLQLVPCLAYKYKYTT